MSCSGPGSACSPTLPRALPARSWRRGCFPASAFTSAGIIWAIIDSAIGAVVLLVAISLIRRIARG